MFRYEFGLNWLCKLFKFSKSSFYHYLNNKAKQDEVDFHVDEMFHEHNVIAGYRKIYHYLKQKEFQYSLNTVRLTMKRLGLQSVVQKKKNWSKPGRLCIPFNNQLDGKFKAVAPNRVWYSDFTYIKLTTGIFIYVCLIVDAFDNSIVGCGISKRIDSLLAKSTLEVTLRKVGKIDGLIFHTDQGVQYRSKMFTMYCKTVGILQSMSRAGTPTDNAVCENVVGKLKNELINHYEYKHINELSESVLSFCYNYYNDKRVNQILDYLTPNEYRNKYLQIC